MEGQTNQEKKPSKLDEFMNAPLQATGGEVPPGSYGAVLFGFSEPVEMDARKSKFYKPGDPDKKLMIEARFGVFDKNGVPTFVEYFLPMPDGGMTNRKSNFYKMLKALANGDAKLIDGNGNFPKGTTLKSFIGLRGVVSVKNNEKEFPNIEAVNPPVDGAKYPTVEQCASIAVSSDDSSIPF